MHSNSTMLITISIYSLRAFQAHGFPVPNELMQWLPMIERNAVSTAFWAFCGCEWVLQSIIVSVFIKKRTHDFMLQINYYSHKPSYMNLTIGTFISSLYLSKILWNKRRIHMPNMQADIPEINFYVTDSNLPKDRV